MHRLFGAFLALALTGGFAQAATLTATPATVVAQVQAAQPGDVVQLQSGIYTLNLFNIAKAAPGVTITPAAGAAVTATGINASGSTNLVFDGIEVAMAPATQYGVVVGSGGQGVVFRRLKVHQADNQTLAGAGAFIRNASGVTVDSGEFAWAGVGVSVMDSDHVTVSNNRIHDVAVDGIDLAGTPDAVVKGNSSTNHHPPSGAHPDFIQWFATTKTPKPCNIDIEGNSYDRGTGGIAQGIFGEGGCNVTIKGNVLRGTMYNGIALSSTAGAVIAGNFVDGYPDMGTRILVRGGCDNVQITGNAAQAVVNYVVSTEPACTNVTLVNNATLQPAALGDDGPLNAWLAAAAPPPAVDPLQGTVDALNAKVADLTTQLQTATDELAALKAKIAAGLAALTQ